MENHKKIEPLKKLYYTISEVSKIIKIQPSTIRFWEKEFSKVLKIKKNKKGNRIFTKKDIISIQKIYVLLKEKKFTIDGAKKSLTTEFKNNSIDIITDLEHIKKELKIIQNQLLY